MVFMRKEWPIFHLPVKELWEIVSFPLEFTVQVSPS